MVHATQATMFVALMLLLAVPGAAHRGRQAMRGAALPQLHREGLATIPVRMYADDCWKHRPVRRIALSEKTADMEGRLPGAGMNPENIQPFQTVLKDGFLEIACAKDYLLNHGDKFGDGKDIYKLGDVSNVSIVHYTSMVAKEDREIMTHEVCFKFCRTVPDMLTFGIHNGRDCYCAPYFKPMESDSTACDAVCEGNPTQFCGGEFKSSVFDMHQCSDTAAELNETNTKAGTVLALLDQSLAAVQNVSTGMQDAAEALQKAFGAAGDPAAADLMQKAKVTAGELESAETRSIKIKDALTTATGEAAGMSGSLSGIEEISQAEALTKRLEKLTADAEDAVEDLDQKKGAASPSGPGFDNAVNATKQYYPVMYFVDKNFTDVPATCTGEPAGQPMAALSGDDCAHACDSAIHDCVGFAFFEGATNLCFLFSKITEATYYTGCGSTLLLQKMRSELPAMACMAKLSKFDGASLKPDGSGQCEGCLKKVTEAARCVGAVP